MRRPSLTSVSRISIIVVVSTVALVTVLVAMGKLHGDSDDDDDDDDAKAVTTVLFMCPHGAAKSVLASAYFKQLAAERGIRVRVDAAGTEPAPAVSPAVATRLEGQGLSVPISKPRQVTTGDVSDADIVISIGCDTSKIPANAKAKLRQWDDVPDTSADLAAADKALRAKAQALLEEVIRLRAAHKD